MKDLNDLKRFNNINYVYENEKEFFFMEDDVIHIIPKELIDKAEEKEEAVSYH